MARARLLNQKAQNIVEYILLVTIVIAVLAIFTKPRGYFQNSVNQILDAPVNQFEWMVEQIVITNNSIIFP